MNLSELLSEYKEDDLSVQQLYAKYNPTKYYDEQSAKFFKLLCKETTKLDIREALTHRNVYKVPMFSLDKNVNVVHFPSYELMLYYIDAKLAKDRLSKFITNKKYLELLEDFYDKDYFIMATITNVLLPRFVAIYGCPSLPNPVLVWNSIPRTVRIIFSDASEDNESIGLSDRYNVIKTLRLYYHLTRKIDDHIEHLYNNIGIFMAQLYEFFKYFAITQKGIRGDLTKEHITAFNTLFLHHFLSKLFFPNIIETKREQLYYTVAKQLDLSVAKYSHDYKPTLSNLFHKLSLSGVNPMYKNMHTVLHMLTKLHIFAPWYLSNAYGLLYALLAKQLGIPYYNVPVMNRFISIKLNVSEEKE